MEVNKTLAIELQDLREQIANEIEALHFSGSNSKNIQDTCAAIARGK